MTIDSLKEKFIKHHVVYTQSSHTINDIRKYRNALHKIMNPYNKGIPIEGFIDGDDFFFKVNKEYEQACHTVKELVS